MLQNVKTSVVMQRDHIGADRIRTVDEFTRNGTGSRAYVAGD